MQHSVLWTMNGMYYFLFSISLSNYLLKSRTRLRVKSSLTRSKSDSYLSRCSAPVSKAVAKSDKATWIMESFWNVIPPPTVFGLDPEMEKKNNFTFILDPKFWCKDYNISRVIFHKVSAAKNKIKLSSKLKLTRIILYPFSDFGLDSVHNQNSALHNFWLSMFSGFFQDILSWKLLKN